MAGKITLQKYGNQRPILEIKVRDLPESKADSICVYVVFSENVIVASTYRIIIIQVNLTHILSMLLKPRIIQSKAYRVTQVQVSTWTDIRFMEDCNQMCMSCTDLN